jgi:VWFA-related protein
MRAILNFLLAMAITGHAADAQDPVPRFRSGVDVVTVETSVFDGSGKPVTDLKTADFVVTVGGKPRRVRDSRFYNNGAIESIAPAREASPTAPATNGTDDGRIVVLVVDRESITPGAERAILESATSLLDGLRPADAAGVLELPGTSLELTRDHARVRAAIIRMTGTRPSLVTTRDYDLRWDEALAYERNDALTIATVIERECSPLNRPEGLRNPCPPEIRDFAFEMLREGRARTQTVLSNLSALARQLEPLRGAKQVVVLSSGFPFGQDLLPLYDNFAEHAAAAQIVFYAVHLDQPGTDASARRTTTSVFGGAYFASGLGNVASMTGGAFFMASGNAATIFERVANEIHNFYELAVEVDPVDLKSGPVEIDVKVNRRGLSVRNRRRALVAARPAPPNTDRLSEMLQQPIDIGEVPVALSVYTMRGDEASTLRTLVGLEAGDRPAQGRASGASLCSATATWWPPDGRNSMPPPDHGRPRCRRSSCPATIGCARR